LTTETTKYTEYELKRPTLPAEGGSCKKNHAIKLKDIVKINLQYDKMLRYHGNRNIRHLRQIQIPSKTTKVTKNRSAKYNV